MSNVEIRSREYVTVLMKKGAVLGLVLMREMIKVNLAKMVH